MTAGTAARLTSSRTAPLVGTENLTFFGDQGRRILRLYHLYRLTIGLALVLLISSDLHNDLLQMSNPQLFQYGAWLYLILNIIVAVLVQSPERDLPVLSLALMDVILLSGLFYFGGGTPSGIGNLLIVAVAIANILLRGRVGFFIAAVAATGLIYLTFYLSISRSEASSQYVQAGALGTLCFAAAFLVQGLTRRLQVSETLARQRAEEVANLEALNALILQRMRTGIMVLDPQERVLLANQGRCSCSARNRWPASASRRAARSCSRHCSTGVAIPHCARPTSRPPRRTDAAAEFRRPAARQQARHSGVPRGHLADRPEGPATQARLSRTTHSQHCP